MIFYQNSNAVCSKVNKVRWQFLTSIRVEYEISRTKMLLRFTNLYYDHFWSLSLLSTTYNKMHKINAFSMKLWWYFSSYTLYLKDHSSKMLRCITCWNIFFLFFYLWSVLALRAFDCDFCKKICKVCNFKIEAWVAWFQKLYNPFKTLHK